MERRIGFLERVSGHTFDTIYDLLFTTERVITLMVQHPAEVPHQFGVKELLFGGLLVKKRGRFDWKTPDQERFRAYEEKTFDELLAGHRFNFEIPYSMVTTVEVTRGLFQTRLKFLINSPANTGHAIHFTLAKDQIPEAQNLLKLALPLKIKEK
jgi:hypothetical protein